MFYEHTRGNFEGGKLLALLEFPRARKNSGVIVLEDVGIRRKRLSSPGEGRFECLTKDIRTDSDIGATMHGEASQEKFQQTKQIPQSVVIENCVGER